METTLYDKAGQPTAYIATDKTTIYFWSGKAAAYIDGENSMDSTDVTSDGSKTA